MTWYGIPAFVSVCSSDVTDRGPTRMSTWCLTTEGFFHSSTCRVTHERDISACVLLHLFYELHQSDNSFNVKLRQKSSSSSSSSSSSHAVVVINNCTKHMNPTHRAIYDCTIFTFYCSSTSWGESNRQYWMELFQWITSFSLNMKFMKHHKHKFQSHSGVKDE